MITRSSCCTTVTRTNTDLGPLIAANIAEEPAGIVYCPPESPYKTKYRSTGGQDQVQGVPQKGSERRGLEGHPVQDRRSTDRVDVVRVGEVRGGQDGGEVSLPGGQDKEVGQGGGGPVSLQGQSHLKIILSLSFFVQSNDHCILTGHFAADTLRRTIDLIWRIHYKAKLRAVWCLCKAFILCL